MTFSQDWKTSPLSEKEEAAINAAHETSFGHCQRLLGSSHETEVIFQHDAIGHSTVRRRALEAELSALRAKSADDRLVAINEGIQIGSADMERRLQRAREEGRAEAMTYQAQRERECPVVTADVPGLDPEFREVGEAMIALRMTQVQADSLQVSLTELLCWVEGYKAALGPDASGRSPRGMFAAHAFHRTLTMAQRAAKKAKQP